MSAFVAEKQGQAKVASLLLAQRVRNCFKNEGNRLEFEVWCENRYGKKYVWKKVTA